MTPFKRPPATKFTLSPPMHVIKNTQSSVPVAKFLHPFVDRPTTERPSSSQASKVDSLQFFGCPDNYVRSSSIHA